MNTPEQEHGHAILHTAATFTNMRRENERKLARLQTDPHQLEFDFVAAFEAELLHPSDNLPL